MNALTIAVEDQTYPVLNLPGRPKALLDRTVARIYQVETREINQAVKNNLEKFPPDFYFELTIDEARCLDEIKNFDLIWKKGHLPKAFTALGANMLATILKSEIAIRRAVQIIRAFTALEQIGPSFQKAVLSITSGDRGLIKSLVNENNELRRKISKLDTLERLLKALQEQVNTLTEQMPNPTLQASQLTVSIPDNTSTLTEYQLDLLRKEAVKKGKKHINKLWGQFRRRFDVTRYSHLPACHFQEALVWIKNWRPK